MPDPAGALDLGGLRREPMVFGGEVRSEERLWALP
jgi:hypothetical protein